MCEDPKGAKKQASHQFLFVLLGSSSAKAAHKTLVKSTQLSMSFTPVIA